MRSYGRLRAACPCLRLLQIFIAEPCCNAIGCAEPSGGVSMSDKTLCSKCDGKGWTVPDDADEPGKTDNVTCDKCGGDGFTYD